MDAVQREDGRLTAYDRLAAALQELRLDRGAPSYSEIARRIGERRETLVPPGYPAIRPSKTTVYDVFRFGRRRIDVALALEIVRALGGDDEDVTRWARQYADAARDRAAAIPLRAPELTEPVERAEPVVAIVVPSPRPAPEDQPGLLDHVHHSRGPASPDPVAAIAATHAAADRAKAAQRRTVLMVMALGVLLDLAGHAVSRGTGLPLSLDLLGTAFAAVTLGPWRGVVVGLLASAGELTHLGWVPLAFAPVSVVGALLWGYGVWRLGYGRTVPRFFALNTVAAVVCTVVALPAVALSTSASMSSSIVTSLAGGLLSGFAALLLVELLPAGVRRAQHELTFTGVIAHNRAYPAGCKESLWRLGPAIRPGH